MLQYTIENDRGHPVVVAIPNLQIAATLAALMTVGLASIAWVVTLQRMNDIRMPGSSFASFVGLWVLMMAAMMLPGAAPAAFKYARTRGWVLGVPLFVASYVAVWTLVGVALYAVYPLYRPYGTLAAGAVAIAAGVYELTPLKQYFRRRCCESMRSGVEFGVLCVGSTIGLMLLMVVLGLMSATWMFVITAIGVTQKLLPAQAAIDVPVALAIVGLGILIVVAPASVPGFFSPM